MHLCLFRPTLASSIAFLRVRSSYYTVRHLLRENNAWIRRIQYTRTRAANNSMVRTLPQFSSIEEVKSLVCGQCWDKVFNTQAYQSICMAERDEHGQLLNISSVTNTTMGYVRESSMNGCSWCAFIWAFRHGDENCEDPDVSWEASLSLSPAEHTTTPVGTNQFYFNLKPNHNDDTKKDLGSSLLVSAYTRQDDRAAQFVTARPLQTDVSSPAAGLQIATWMEKCKVHDCCSAHSDTPLPLRVIEVSPKERPDHPRLLTTKGLKGQYATLSYCWGTHSNYLLKTSTINEFSEGLDMDAIPQTIFDAISVARSIPVDYLWIDALCILQDSTEDKVIELAKMKDIYRNSLVTIVAATADEVSKGFLQPRSGVPTGDVNCRLWSHRMIGTDGISKSPWIVPFRIQDGVFGTMTLRCVGCETEYEEGKEIINMRAWTLQEQLMSQRALIYASHTLQWRCRAGTWNLGDSLHQHRYESESFQALIKPSSTPREAFLCWLRIVRRYGCRKLSLPSDKLPAIAGIAKEFFDSLGPYYYAGIWGGNKLVLQLGWSVWHYHSKITSPKTYRAPSWSWASVDGVVIMQTWDPEWDEEKDDLSPLCEIVHIETTLKDISLPFGEITDGHLVLRGKLRRGWLIKSMEEDEDRTIVWSSESIATAATAEANHLAWVKNDQQLEKSNPDEWEKLYDSNPWSKAQFDVGADWPSMLVSCIPLFQNFGMILVQDEKNGTYRRIGSLEFRNSQLTDFHDVPTVEIIII